MGSQLKLRRPSAFSRLGILAKLLLLCGIALAAFVWVFFVTRDSFGQLSKSVSEIQVLQGGLVRMTSDLQAKSADAQLMLYRAGLGAIGIRGKADIGALTSMAGTLEAGTIITSMLPESSARSPYADLVQKVVASYSSYSGLLDSAEARLSEGKGEAQAFISEADASFWQLKGSIDKLQKALRDGGTKSAGAAVALTLSSSLKVDIVIALAFLLIAIITVFIVRSIRLPIALLMKLVEKMGTGDLSDRYWTTKETNKSAMGGDEIGRMGKSVDGLSDNLAVLLGTITDRIATLRKAGQGLSSMMEQTGAAVIQINSNIANTKVQLDEQSSAVGEVAAAIEELARNIDSLTAMIGDQAALVAHSSASVEEMIANIESVALNAETVGAQSERNVTESAEGKAKIDEVSESISAIVRYAENLGEAARIITEIADRTGLLAMNAAIEAAHAGDSGRGFAVVADEIRKLADQSTAQARDISQDLGRVSEAIQAVRGAADLAVLAFASNLERARGVGYSVREISGAMAEQREGGRQVLEALGKLRDITKEIERGSGEMATGDLAILGQMDRLRNVNMVVVQNNEEITRGTQEINEAISGTMDLTSRNGELISEVAMATDRFKFEAAEGGLPS